MEYVYNLTTEDELRVLRYDKMVIMVNQDNCLYKLLQKLVLNICHFEKQRTETLRCRDKQHQNFQEHRPRQSLLEIWGSI